jgi:hypothetical protein
VVLASIQGARNLIPHEVEEFEKRIQSRLKSHDIRLLVRCNDLVDVTSKGHVLYGGAHFGKLTSAEAALQRRIEGITKKRIEGIRNMFATNIDAVKKDGEWFVRAEVVGPKMLSPKEVREVEKEVSRTVRHQVNISVWCRSELMVTRNAYSSIEDFTKELITDTKK